MFDSCTKWQYFQFDGSLHVHLDSPNKSHSFERITDVRLQRFCKDSVWSRSLVIFQVAFFVFVIQERTKVPQE